MAVAVVAGGKAAAAQDGAESCTVFMARFEICIATKVPREERPALQDGLEKMRSALKPAADAPSEVKEKTEQVCSTLAEQIKQQLEPLGCQW